METGHINVHETGAIEAVGHKVISVPGKNGKLTAEDVERVYRLHWEDATHEHMPQPKLVYISMISSPGMQTQLGGRNMWKRWFVRSNRQKNHIKSTV